MQHTALAFAIAITQCLSAPYTSHAFCRSVNMTETVIMRRCLLNMCSTHSSCKATGALLRTSLVQILAVDSAYYVPYATLATFHDTG